MPRYTKAIKALIVGVSTGLLGLVFSFLPFGIGAEESIGLDLLFKLRGNRQPPPDIVIVTMDKVSAETLEVPTDPDKWPRSLHAILTRNLTNLGAAVIVFDIMFEDVRSEKDNRLFADAIHRAGNVILCECLRKDIVSLSNREGMPKGNLSIEKLVPPIHPLAESALALAPFPLPKVPVKVSQFWTFKTGAGDRPTLPVVALQIFSLDHHETFFRMLEGSLPDARKTLPPNKEAVLASGRADELVHNLRSIFQKDPQLARRMLEELDKRTGHHANREGDALIRSLIKMYEGPNSHYLNFYGPPGIITTVPYYEVLQSGKGLSDIQNGFNVKGKAVFVGLSERLRPEQKDGFYTVFSQPSGVDISGVEIAATAFGNLLEDIPVRPLAPMGVIAVIFCWGLVLGSMCIFLPTPAAAFSVIGLGGLCLLFAQNQFGNSATWYPLVVPLFVQTPFAFFGTVLWEHYKTTKERVKYRRTYGLPDHFVDRLFKDFHYIKPRYKQLYGICLFTDITEFTALSERVGAPKLSDLTSPYWMRLLETMWHHGGRIGEFRGDSVKIDWTNERPDALPRREACLATVESAKNIELFNQSHSGFELPTRFGLHCGQVAYNRLGNTTGETVNVASRMESLNKHLGTNILASGQVVDQVEEILFREIGSFYLVGLSKPVAVYELLCRLDDCSEDLQRLHATFADALDAFRNRSWQDALQIFREALTVKGQDGPSNMYLEICQYLSEHNEKITSTTSKMFEKSNKYWVDTDLAIHMESK